jgi:hypothetical protein
MKQSFAYMRGVLAGQGGQQALGSP